MKTFYLYIRVLALAALVDWLITRTLSRAAIHMPKSEVMTSVYEALNRIGQIAGTFVALLAFIVLVWIVWGEWRAQRRYWFAGALAVRIVMSAAFLVIAPEGWVAVSHYLLTIVVIALLIPLRSNSDASAVTRQTIVFLLPGLAVAAGLVYQLLPALYAALGLPGPPPARLAFIFGELAVVLSAIVFWWFHGRSRSRRIWTLAAIPALFFTLAFLRDPAMTGILTIWSTGLSLDLPWLAYVLALWLAGVTLLVAWRRNPPVAWSILLLSAAGYAPQLSPQLFCALIALWLLARWPQIQLARIQEASQPEGQAQGRVPRVAETGLEL